MHIDFVIPAVIHGLLTKFILVVPRIFQKILLLILVVPDFGVE